MRTDSQTASGAAPDDDSTAGPRAPTGANGPAVGRSDVAGSAAAGPAAWAEGWLATLSFSELARARFSQSPAHAVRRARAGFSGSAPGRRRGAGSELESIGPYEPGDDPRLIDWSATARTGTPQVRRFLQDAQPPQIVVVDLRAHMYFGSARQLLARRACLAAAGLCTQALAADRACALIILSRHDAALPPCSGKRARARLLASLQRAYHDGLGATQGWHSQALDVCLIGVTAAMPRRAHWTVVSDFSNLGDDLRATLAHRAPQRVDAVAIEDPLATTTMVPGRYPMRAGHPDSYRLEHVRVREPAAPDARAWRRALTHRLARAGFAGTISIAAVGRPAPR